MDDEVGQNQQPKVDGQTLDIRSPIWPRDQGARLIGGRDAGGCAARDGGMADGATLVKSSEEGKALKDQVARCGHCGRRAAGLGVDSMIQCNSMLQVGYGGISASHHRV